MKKYKIGFFVLYALSFQAVFSAFIEKESFIHSVFGGLVWPIVIVVYDMAKLAGFIASLFK